MSKIFDEEACLIKLKHFLPAQAPLKDFVHHNTLHAFQDLDFYEALRKSAVIFGNRTTLSLSVFKEKYKNGEITDKVIDSIILDLKPEKEFSQWKKLMFSINDSVKFDSKIGRLRKHWENDYSLDIDGMVRPNFVRIINSYLDQGIAFDGFPLRRIPLLDAVQRIQKESYVKFFKSKRAIEFLFKEDKNLSELLELVVGDQRFYEQYLIDQQYSHPGLSGMICAIEAKPDSVYANRPVTLFDAIYLELLFELEALEKYVNRNFKPLTIGVKYEPENIFDKVETNNYWEVIELWQESFEAMYHDQVLKGLTETIPNTEIKYTSQAFFCIDDREESIRRNIEMFAPDCQTFGTPAHFNIVARFKPEGAKFSTQICPGPFTPVHVIKETNRKNRPKKDFHFDNSSHTFFKGFVLSQSLGFISSLKLLGNIFRPKESNPQYNATKDHMDYDSTLIYENKNGEKEDGHQIGFTVSEMIDIVTVELQNTGLTTKFASIVYHFGHGGSSTNNPYFAGYNCGACSGRPSTVNARLFAIMANRNDVRSGVREKGIDIPNTTHFVGAYHDTTVDTFAYFDEDVIPKDFYSLHEKNKVKFSDALDMNAKERARQFRLENIKRPAKNVHKDVINRSYSLFEPRPEYNHSNNALFIVGNRSLTKNLFLDQRAFLNSYDYRQDKDGKYLENILNAGTGVCGGINLEYFFSSVDNEKLGAGSKLPQNVVGLYAVANGVKGDLRPGLPWQMIDVHDPVRILTVVENTPEFVMEVLNRNPSTFDWYRKNWMRLSVYDPYKKEVFILKKGEFVPYQSITDEIKKMDNFETLFEHNYKNLPVYKLN